MTDYNLEKRKFVIGGIAVAIIIIYLARLFALQVMSDDYKKNADSNAFLKKIQKRRLQKMYQLVQFLYLQ